MNSSAKSIRPYTKPRPQEPGAPPSLRLATSEDDSPGLAALCGTSRPMLQLLNEMKRVARADMSVLLHGETGTGKDTAARAIHALSPRPGSPFVVVDCAALHPDLALSELFGHARGAFTGAQSDHIGHLEQAHDGTLFLDEVDELPPSVQPALLRALATGAFTRLGETQPRISKFRTIAASRRDLGLLVRKEAFRPDLFFRLAAVVLHVPALRDRREDIPQLVNHFALRAGARAFPLEPSELAAFYARDWPGNLRELRNEVERAIILGTRMTGQAMGAAPVVTFQEARQAAVDCFERSYLKALLDWCDGSPAVAARQAGMAQSYFYRLLKKHGIQAKRACSHQGQLPSKGGSAPNVRSL
jgi:DNA-binding NtrC family response regulator